MNEAFVDMDCCGLLFSGQLFALRAGGTSALQPCCCASASEPKQVCSISEFAVAVPHDALCAYACSVLMAWAPVALLCLRAPNGVVACICKILSYLLVLLLRLLEQ